MTTIRVLLADDHTVLRQSVRLMLDREGDFEVVGECSDGREALARATALRPDVVVLDLAMPGSGGLGAIPKIRKAVPSTAVVVFTMHDNPTYVYEAMQAGAAAYVLKNVGAAEFLRALRAAAGGDTFLQAEVTGPLLRRIAREARMSGGRVELSLREIEVLEHLADGKTNRQIAQHLDVSEETIKTHLKHVYDKLGATDRAHAVAIALRQSLIQ